MSKTKTNVVAVKREPLLRLVKRENANLFYRFFVRAAAIGVAFFFIFMFLQAITKYDFNQISYYLNLGAFGSKYSTNETFKNTLMLTAIGIGLAPAFKMRFWNIGAQGQILFGALLAAMVVKYFGGNLSNGILVLIMFVVAVVGGGLWAFIPAIFKVKLGANETLFTLMMNYIAIKLVACFVDLWKGKATALAPFKTGFLPDAFGNSYGMVYLLVGILAVAMFIYLKSTKHGYEISVVGESINTAKYAGINTKKVILRTIFISGAVCGFCGFLYMGNVHTISTAVGGDYGFTAIIVAWAAKFNPFVMAGIAFAIVFLEAGSKGIVDNTENVNSYISYIIVGIFLFILIGCEFFVNYKLKFNAKITLAYKKFIDKLEQKCPKTIAVCKSIAYSIATVYKKLENFVTSCINKMNAVLSKAVAIVIAPVNTLFIKINDKVKAKNKTKPKLDAPCPCTECEKPTQYNDIDDLNKEEADND